MKVFTTLALVVALAAPAAAKPVERRLHSDNIDASSFLWNDWNKFVENYHPNYVADDDPVTAWVEGAKGSGAGEWLRIQVTPLDKTTRVRLRVRNGYQKSKDLWKANARAKAVTVRLLPSKTEKQVTLTDTDGWQEVVVDQPSGALRTVELAIGSVYEGGKYPDLCISDVQVLATSETPDNPAFEKSKLANLLSWRSARIAASQVFSAKKVELPIHPAYEIKKTPWKDELSPNRADLLASAAKDPVFAKEWKDALAAAAALEQNLASMTRAQLAPASQARLVEVDGLQITEVGEIQSGEGPYLESDAIRLPMLGLVSAMFADQLRVLDVKDRQTIAQFEQSEQRTCGADAAWVSRAQPKEGGPARVAAIAIGRCAKLEGRGGSYIGRTIELMIYDATGKLVLVVGEGHLEGYRWSADAGKPMLAGGRSLLWEGFIVEAKRRGAVASK
jgi:hypothetical protein